MEQDEEQQQQLLVGTEGSERKKFTSYRGTRRRKRAWGINLFNWFNIRALLAFTTPPRCGHDHINNGSSLSVVIVIIVVIVNGTRDDDCSLNDPNSRQISGIHSGSHPPIQ